MAKFKADIGGWIPDDIRRFSNASNKVRPIMKIALYEGAKVVLDNLSKAAGKHGTLANGLGATMMREGGDIVDISIGFAGYDENGTPYPLIANVLEYGTSTGYGGDPFFERTVRASRKQAEEAMRKRFHECMNNTLGEK